MEVGLAVFFVAAVVALPKFEMADRDPSLDPLVGDVVSGSAEDWENAAISAMEERDELARAIPSPHVAIASVAQHCGHPDPGASNHNKRVQDSDGAG